MEVRGLKAIGPEEAMPITILMLTVVDPSRRKRIWPTMTRQASLLPLAIIILPPHRGDMIKINLWLIWETRATHTTSTWVNMLFKMTTCTHRPPTELNNQRVAPVSSFGSRAPTTRQLVLLRVDRWLSEVAFYI